MKLRLSVIVAVVGLLLLSSCKQASETVVISGDSWASFLCTFKSFDRALEAAGLDAATNSTCLLSTKAGARSNVWLKSIFHQATKTAISDPKAKVLFFSMGGNDVIADWNKSMSAAEEKLVLDKVADEVDKIVKTYLALRPDIKIIISGYDYPRFTADHPIEAYRKMYENMGSPTPYELNSFLNRFSDRMAKLADQKSIFYMHHNGLMHYYYGNSETELAPFKTLSPDLISSPDNVMRVGGDPSAQSDKTAMLTVSAGGAVLYDAFHLSHAGYGKLAEHTIKAYLMDWLKTKK